MDDNRIKIAANLAEDGLKVQAAARKMQISASGVYAELQRRRAHDQGICSMCRQETDAVDNYKRFLIDALQTTISQTTDTQYRIPILQKILNFIEQS